MDKASYDELLSAFAEVEKSKLAADGKNKLKAAIAPLLQQLKTGLDMEAKLKPEVDAFKKTQTELPKRVDALHAQVQVAVQAFRKAATVFEEVAKANDKPGGDAAVHKSIAKLTLALSKVGAGRIKSDVTLDS